MKPNPPPNRQPVVTEKASVRDEELAPGQPYAPRMFSNVAEAKAEFEKFKAAMTQKAIRNFYC